MAVVYNCETNFYDIGQLEKPINNLYSIPSITIELCYTYTYQLLFPSDHGSCPLFDGVTGPEFGLRFNVPLLFASPPHSDPYISGVVSTLGLDLELSEYMKATIMDVAASMAAEGPQALRIEVRITKAECMSWEETDRIFRQVCGQTDVW